MSRTRAGGSATKPSTGLDHARAQELLSEPALLRQIVATSECTVGDEREPGDGLYVETTNLITSEGWISAGPGYSRDVLDDQMLVDVSPAVSWKLCNVVKGVVELHPSESITRAPAGSAFPLLAAISDRPRTVEISTAVIDILCENPVMTEDAGRHPRG